MHNNTCCHYFLGANSKDGFYSLYNDFINAHSDVFLWCIKGGPGCGKSTFMRRICRMAEENGLLTEYILCSGDPDSLDGVYIPQASLMYVDATSPHVVEPSLPGANSSYLDLSEVYRDRASLKKIQPDIRKLFSRYKKEYAAAYDLLRAAENCSPEKLPDIYPDNITDVIKETASSLLSGVPASSGYREERRFMSALSCRGHLHLYENITSFEKVCLVDNEAGLAQRFLEVVRLACVSLGQPVRLFPDPLDPLRWEAIALPEAGLAVIGTDPAEPYNGPVYTTVPLDTMASFPLRGEAGRTWQTRRTLQKDILSLAGKHLSLAKKHHDELEEIYRPYVDFSVADRLFEEHSTGLFRK